ncbi:hypothetical protein JHK82_022639 [Glycine max]|nr:hypothetical protein JHK86_022662 [Glycine max]KAG5137908.1 hypothetical protein JHK82_022639 [Glycine max]
MVRVVCLWMVSNVSTHKQTYASKIPLSMEMVRVDSKGDRIHGFVKRTLIYKFEKSLQEGKVYSVQFFGVTDIGGVGTERENEKNGRRTRMNVIQIEDDEFSIECTLCGPFVDELNAFLASGEVKDVVTKYIFPSTRVVFNAECEEVKELATRYRIKIRVIDESDSITFVIFDRDATILLSKSCANMFETYQKRGLARTFPKEITNLVDKSFLFKVKKGKTNGVGMDVEPMQSQSLEMHLPPKSLKKRIKVEKI